MTMHKTDAAEKATNEVCQRCKMHRNNPSRCVLFGRTKYIMRKHNACHAFKSKAVYVEMCIPQQAF